MGYLRIIFGLLIGSVLWTSCSDEVNSRLAPKPTALGKINDVVVVTDETIWQSMPGDTFRYFYESAYPIMPTPEPLFDLRHFTTSQIEAEPLRKELRTYVILANLLDEASPTTKMVRRDLGEEKYQRALKDTTLFSSVGSDKWAREQVIFYVFGPSHDALATAIKKTFPAIADRIKKHDEKQLYSNIYAVYKENVSVSNTIKEYTGLDLKIPGDFADKVMLDQNFILLKKDLPKYAQTIAIRKFAYKDASQLTKEAIIEMRNDYGKTFITGASEGSYMQVNQIDLPIYEYSYEINGAYTKELRGIWELNGDFVGGPFVTYVILNKVTNELVMIDTFVYAPGKDKRDYIQQLEYIVKHAKVIGLNQELGE